MGARGVRATDVFDVGGTLKRFGGDADLFREMASIVLADAPTLAQELASAVQARDAKAIQMKAHAIKGLIIGCGGIRASHVAQKLEDGGRDGCLTDSNRYLADFETEMQRFMVALQSYASGYLTGQSR